VAEDGGGTAAAKRGRATEGERGLRRWGPRCRDVAEGGRWRAWRGAAVSQTPRRGGRPQQGSVAARTAERRDSHKTSARLQEAEPPRSPSAEEGRGPSATATEPDEHASAAGGMGGCGAKSERRRVRSRPGRRAGRQSAGEPVCDDTSPTGPHCPLMRRRHSARGGVGRCAGRLPPTPPSGHTQERPSGLWRLA